MNRNNQNPNSHFFDPDENTYTPRHSSICKERGKDYIASTNSLLLQGDTIRTDISQKPELGVVFVTVKRKNEQYLEAALGSFMRDLKREQREKMKVVVNIGDFNPTDHPFYNTAWLHGLVDQVGVRMSTGKLDLHLPTTSTARMAQIQVTPVPITDIGKNPLKTSTWHRKATLDYAFALNTCHQIGAPYCIIAEDDIVFATDWYSQVESMLAKADRVASPNQWGYIRLFWAEKYFGWESDEVPTLVFGCITATVLTAILLFGFCRLPARHVLDREKDRDYHQLSGRLRSEVSRVRLPLISILILVVVVLVHAILFILAGRNHVYKVPNGLSSMPSRGCCTQAIVYPSDIVQPLATHLIDHSGEKPYDIMINRWMEAHQREKLAVNPPILQHVGEGSSRQMAEDYWRRTPLWSFAFEKV